MCGIAGIVGLDGSPVSPVVMQRMTDVLVHRGPDGEGHWIEGSVGLGHRRLAIIDLSPAGRQPMISADHRYVLTYNGEVYNYRELRTELEAAGFWFRSRTDSEVVLQALAHWGADALKRFNGMFALALWDRKSRELLLARDRHGVKPLYYARQGNTFSFGSEQKAILAQPYFNAEPDLEALYEYFTFQNIFTDKTLIQDIKLLPAGHFGVLKLLEREQRFNPKAYWDYEFREPTRVESRDTYLEELDHLFRQAVNRQLVSDVEIGSYLSGGMDSGSITAISSRSVPYLKTFTCGFDLSSASGIELGFDEREKAEAMSALFKTEHYEMVLKAGDMERCLPSLAWHLEEPRVGQSYPNYYAAKLAGKFVRVVLSGSGGDELFGGYPWRYYRGASSRNFDDYIDQYYSYWQRLVNQDEAKGLFSPVWSRVSHVSTRDIFRNVFEAHDNELRRPEDYINHSLYFEAKTFLHGLFVVEDKISMAHSLESRVPFMDNDLVDFAMRCPVGFKLNNLAKVSRVDENDPGDKPGKFIRKTNDGKQILRDVMGRYIPSSITRAEKQGFSSPDASWFKGESINFVKKRLLGPNAKIYTYLDYHTVQRLIQQHLDGLQNRRLLIWSLLSIEQWLDSEFLHHKVKT